jgi:hypothetical protein
MFPFNPLMGTIAPKLRADRLRRQHLALRAGGRRGSTWNELSAVTVPRLPAAQRGRARSLGGGGPVRGAEIPRCLTAYILESFYDAWRRLTNLLISFY